MKNNNKKQFNGNSVVVGDLPIAVALRKFKQKVEDSGVLEEYKDHMFYEKPTTTRKKKTAAAKARWNKQLRDQSLPKKMF